MKRYTIISLSLAGSLMAMTSLFAAFMVSFGAGDRDFGSIVLLMIYLFGALSILFAIYLESLERNRSKILRGSSKGDN
ncbi:MAG TPA: hypothetical protein VIH03_01500 [Nitrososphaerales archaeon]